MSNDGKWMDAALAEAGKAVGLTAPNPPVGAVVVKEGRVLGRGFHAKAGAPHAEPVALNQAGDAARGADLYVTLEPCSTTGRTPPCTEAIKRAGIRRVVMGCLDPNPAHAGHAIAILTAADIQAETGAREAECRELIRAFAHLQTTARPYLTLKLGCSLDGRIADRTGTSQWITGPDSRERVQALRREADAILVGTETVRRDNPSLLPRPAHGRAPVRLVPDRRGKLPLMSKVFTDPRAEHTLCLLGPGAPEARARKLGRAGVRVERARERNGRLDWTSILTRLGRAGVMHVLCEGGGQLAAALLRAGLVNEIHWIAAPKLLGRSGRPAVDEAFSLARAPGFALRDVERVGDDVWMRLVPGEGDL